MTDYAEEIRAAAQALLTAEAVTAGRTYRLVRDNWGWPLDTQDYPALSVFLPKETMTPDGDANAGEPSFVHDCTIFIAVSLGFDTPEGLAPQLAERGEAILATLLQTVSFRLPVPGQVPRFESVERIEVETVFAKEGETFIAERQIRFTVRYRTDWPPNVPDRFESMAVTLKPKGAPVPPPGSPPPPPNLIIDVPQEPAP